MNQAQVRLLITDLDNTLYDWVSSFVPAMLAMVEVGAPALGVTPDQLLDELREVHQLHGNSEHPYALLETRSAKHKYSDVQIDRIPTDLDDALHAFNRVRKTALKLYDGVLETLKTLLEREVPVVAFTDARVPNSLFRLQKLELVPLLARLYAPRPRYELPQLARSVIPVSDEFVRVLSADDRKPNPKALLDICDDFRVLPSQVVYVGDSLTRDVYMARQAGVVSAWAKYGTEYDRSLWKYLTKVTHWTESDVQSEEELRDRSRGVRADVELTCFAELLTCFEFS